MLLLATDTSGKEGSIALARCETDVRCEVIDMAALAGGTFSALLIPQIAEILSKNGLNKTNIDAFAVCVGPGSFTGLRVGLAAIKGLAEILEKPIAAVSLLEAVALSAQRNGAVLAALDAGRQEVYLGTYEVCDSVAELIREELMTRAELLDSQLLKSDGVTLVTPDAILAASANGIGARVQEIKRPSADAIARIGWSKMVRRKTVSAENLDANYIRRAVG